MSLDLTPVASPPVTALEELRALLPGRVTGPSDPGWDSRRLGWALSVDQAPLAVVDVRDVQDVVTAVRTARAHGLAVAAQPVGHGATRALDGTILLRTRSLDEITVVPEERWARVGAGVKWGEVLAATEPFGLTGLPGSSPDPSVVGFTLGGGLSWFSRKHGLAAYGVRAVELVDAGGRAQRVTPATDPDLFWALRGGGGDFGIVTALEIDLHPVPQLQGGRLLWPMELARPVLRAYRRLTAEAPDELSAWAQLFRFPPTPDVPEPLRGGAFVSVDVTFLGSTEVLAGLLAPLREIPALVADTVAELPLSRLGDVAAEPVDPMPVRELSGRLSDLDDADLDRLVDAVGAATHCPLAVVQLRHLGGALRRADAEDGPQGAICEQYQVFCLGVPVVPELVPAIDDGFAAVRSALAERWTGRTSYNFLGDSDDPRRAFTAGALERLRRVKATVDPEGTFRANRPVLRPEA